MNAKPQGKPQEERTSREKRLHEERELREERKATAIKGGGGAWGGLNPGDADLLHKVLWLFVAGVIFVLFFMAAYFVSGILFARLNLTGLLPPEVRYLLTVFLGFALFGLVGFTVTFVGKRLSHKGFSRVSMEALLFDAMDRIAHGDFNVFISPKVNGMYIEVVDAINKMAQQLGTMEILRQDFISNVSHEIQSPLTSISGFAKLLQDQDASLSPEQRAHYLAIIEAESKRLSKLSDNLMKLSSLESSSVPINCGDFRLDRQLQSVTLMLEPQWQAKRLKVEANLTPTTYNGDEELLAQVWVNLLNNAIKFTPEGGTLSITLTEEERECDGAQCVVRIADTGIGIAPEDQMHIFERFYKGDKARERAAGGNGLGLSLTKKILELHNARIYVESTLGEGSVFTVLL